MHQHIYTPYISHRSQAVPWARPIEESRVWGHFWEMDRCLFLDLSRAWGCGSPLVIGWNGWWLFLCGTHGIRGEERRGEERRGEERRDMWRMRRMTMMGKSLCRMTSPDESWHTWVIDVKVVSNFWFLVSTISLSSDYSLVTQSFFSIQAIFFHNLPRVKSLSISVNCLHTCMYGFGISLSLSVFLHGSPFSRFAGELCL